MNEPTTMPTPPTKRLPFGGDPKGAARKAAEARARIKAEGKKPTAAPTANRAPKGKAARIGAGVERLSAMTRKRLEAVTAMAVVGADELAARFVRVADQAGNVVYAWADERLEPKEARRLVEALVVTLARYPKLAKKLEVIGVVNELAPIPVALLYIAIPRLVAHRVVPSSVGDALRGALDTTAGAPVSMGAGGAHGDIGPDRERQEHPRGEPAPAPESGDLPPFQAGSGEVWERGEGAPAPAGDGLAAPVTN